MRCFTQLVLAALIGVCRVAHAQNATSAGEATAPFPTFENISLEWAISGDENANGVVRVQYRKQGETTFRSALPLFRVPAGSNQGFSWGNKHAGSVFGLEPATTYEVELSLSDADGGEAKKTLLVTTRSFPAIPARGREVAVTPAGIAGALRAAKAGDVLVLEDGAYPELVVAIDGSAGQPLALRARNAGSAVVSGDVRLDGRSFVQIEGLTVHGKFKLNDAESIVISGCTIETAEDGIVSYGNGVNNAYVVGNVIRGATTWKESALGVDGDNIGEGVQLTGAGNVVAWNRVSGFRDCLSLLEDAEAVNQVSDDFYGNDLSACADDAIEADFSMGNVRVYHNRISDSFMGISSQPSLGGPTYFLRNVMYNVLYQAFKLQRGSVGDVGLHNTVLKSGDAFSVHTEDVFSRALFRNNLFLGGPGAEYNGYDSGPGNVMELPSADESCSFDYDGYGALASGSYAGRVGDTRFTSLAEQRARTSEQHAVELGLDAFMATPEFPSDPFTTRPFPSLELAATGAAVDQGTPLDNVNDDFTGAKPDLGAYEVGAPLPAYGPEGWHSAGTSSNGGASSSGGASSTGGASSSGGLSGGASAKGGTSSEGARTGNGGNGAAQGGGSNTAARAGDSNAGSGPSPAKANDESGCGCRMSTTTALPSEAAAALVALLALRRRRAAATRRQA